MAERDVGGAFAGTSLARLLIRGLIGFGAIVGSVALIPVLGFAALVLLPVGLVALRGCPTCWAMGVIETISAGRLQRTCANGRGGGRCEISSTRPARKAPAP